MKYKIKFVPGSLDGFDGSQEELDELVKSIMEFVESDEFQEIVENAEAGLAFESEEDLFEHIDIKNISPTIH